MNVFLNVAVVLEIQINSELPNLRSALRQILRDGIFQGIAVEMEELILVIASDKVPLHLVVEGTMRERLTWRSQTPVLLPVSLSIRVSIQKEIQTSRHDTPPDNFLATHPF
jgi:hypothetical protein